MPTDQKIDYIEMPARDFSAIRSFYENAFSWSFTDYGPEYLAFADGKLDGGFYQSDKHTSTEDGAALVVLFAINLEETKDRVIASGGKIVKEIFAFPGGRRFHFADPNNNELAVWSDQ